jgi:hypothetical protein
MALSYIVGSDSKAEEEDITVLSGLFSANTVYDNMRASKKGQSRKRQLSVREELLIYVLPK